MRLEQLAYRRSFSQRIDNYVLTTHCLGTGSFATVHLGMDVSQTTYKQVACKIMKRKKDQRLEKMMKEVRILTDLNHVCHYSSVKRTRMLTRLTSRASTGCTTSYTTNLFCEASHRVFLQRLTLSSCRYIFLQLCTGGDLFSYIVNHKDPELHLHEGEAKYIMYQLILGLKYLHDKSISHRGQSSVASMTY